MNHPAADIFPLMAGVDLDALIEDIRTHGQREPIYLHQDGSILDGRNRYLACQRLGIEPLVKKWRGEGTALAFVISQNLHRRHLDETQRASIAAKLVNTTHGGDRSKSPIGDLITQSKAAEMLNVGKRNVERAQQVHQEGAPELAAAIHSGQIPASLASNLTKDAPETQRAIVQRVKAGEQPAEAVRNVRREVVREKLETVSTVEVKKAEGVYDVLVIDPPWPTQKIERDERPNQVALDYPTMDEAELSALELPVSEDCHVWLWATHKHLPLAFRLLAEWELKYVCTFVWHKPGGFQVAGLPQLNCEFALYARRGSPVFFDTKAFPVCFEAPRGAHSEKPGAFYDVVRRVTAGRRLDMFGRRAIDGFESWGKEAPCELAS